MIRTIYVVHSDTNENNIFQEFYGRGNKRSAISYAKEHKDECTWVEKVEYNTCTEDYRYIGGVWNYEEE